ncbi:protein PLASTID REDOX INSENSITIVE 2, chloroplastic-like [Magnolia sinica]|uniref:protein PLASTID REDOX INSENSITIVE 2, chloroplastic-like n=1 Tax=Magnolia sinica TaxID=86752 RepID=UPI0026597DEA|nr:protein PLASTID REDOX INSENSITIVE 2, chloroplastic-like [Magnolia sinica]
MALLISNPSSLISFSPSFPSKWRTRSSTKPLLHLHHSPIPSFSSQKPLRASTQQPKYVYPDPIPEFAEAETRKFRSQLLKKLSKDKDTFGNDMDAVVNVCTEVGVAVKNQIFNDFLHKEYGGPGTLLVEPFTDMLLVLKEKKLAGAPMAARAALLWAQNYVDHDWEIWTSQPPN